jgi:dihydroflavonol-4-reductase
MSTHHISSPLRLLVTGATGFIGSRLALHAHRLGIDVVATGRAALPVEIDRLQELRDAGVCTQVGMLQDVPFVQELLRGRNAVIHLAAAQHEAEMPEAYFRAVNVGVVRSLLEECRRAHVRRFVYGSTIGIYGSTDDRLLDEDSPARPDNAYTRTKLEAEALVRAERGLESCIIRISETYGPGDLRLLKLFRAIERGHFFMIGAGNNRRQCIHVNDLTRGLLLAAQHPAAIGQTFVLAGREVMTTNEMVRYIASALSRKAPRAQLPMWPFLVTARVMEATLPRLHIHPPLHSRRLDFFSKSFVFSTARAQTLLGFQPEIDFQTGVADTARWYRERRYMSARATAVLADAQSA